MLKSLEQFKMEIHETFEPCNDEYTFGEMVTKQGYKSSYLEGEFILVHSNDNFYNVSGEDFTSFRIDANNDKLFTLANAKLFADVSLAIKYMKSLPEEVTVLTYNIFKDSNGNYTDFTYYVNTLEG